MVLKFTEDFVDIGYILISEYWFWFFFVKIWRFNTKRAGATRRVKPRPKSGCFHLSTGFYVSLIQNCLCRCACVNATVDPKTKVAWWIKLLFAGVSPRRLGFHPRSVEMWYSLGKVALGDISLPIIRSVHVHIITPLLIFFRRRQNLT